MNFSPQRTVLALLTLAVFLLSMTCVWAQSIPVPSNNLSGTITTTNTFQSIQAQANNRNGCAVQNGVNPLTGNGDFMWVYFDKSNSSGCSAATKAASVLLAPGQPVNCAVASNIVLKDQVCITGTSGDTFFANFQ
jgi:hypothetical protein